MKRLPRSHTSARRRGAVLVYSILALVALIAVVSLAVDYGRATLAKTELMSAADGAARAAASRLYYDPSNASAAAVATAAANTADGSPVVLTPGADITFGNWSEPYKTFYPGADPMNAVRVVARRTASRNTAVPTVFASILGKTSVDVSATCIAAYLTTPSPTKVTNKSNPWLAGMPNGTRANSYDSAPTASPTLLVAGALTGGAELTFDATGATSNQEGVEQAYAPDGNLNWIIHNYPGNEHGIADLKAPISSLIGVFLDDNQPDGTAAPSSLDFTTAASRDFATLSPQLKQPFFIGDARRDNGALQKFVVPAGATRLYVGSMDGQQWSDNAGGFAVTITGGATVVRIAIVQ